jgi:hypothetical protein
VVEVVGDGQAAGGVACDAEVRPGDRVLAIALLGRLVEQLLGVPPLVVLGGAVGLGESTSRCVVVSPQAWEPRATQTSGASGWSGASLWTRSQGRRSAWRYWA